MIIAFKMVVISDVARPDKGPKRRRRAQYKGEQYRERRGIPFRAFLTSEHIVHNRPRFL
jgi:hypothetical protein